MPETCTLKFGNQAPPGIVVDGAVLKQDYHCEPVKVLNNPVEPFWKGKIIKA